MINFRYSRNASDLLGVVDCRYCIMATVSEFPSPEKVGIPSHSVYGKNRDNKRHGGMTNLRVKILWFKACGRYVNFVTSYINSYLSTRKYSVSHNSIALAALPETKYGLNKFGRKTCFLSRNFETLAGQSFVAASFKIGSRARIYVLLNEDT